MDIFEHGLNLLEIKSKKWTITDFSVGIVTAADKNVFRGLQALFVSVKNKINFLCYDIGLTTEQKNWCERNNLQLKSLAFPSDLTKLNGWMSYTKPWVIADSPFEYTIWLDTDCVVVGDLTQAELIFRKRTFFVEHFLKQYPANLNYLYEQRPVKADTKNWNYINAGVFGIHKKDIEDLIVNKWQFLINVCIQDSKIKQTCDMYWDEGSLNWSLQKDNSLDFITNNHSYNWPGDYDIIEKQKKDQVNKIPCLFAPVIYGPSLFFDKLLEQSTDKFIIHFATGESSKKPKYFNVWN
jgi:hypothetical protein